MNKSLLCVFFLLFSCSAFAQEIVVIENPVTFHIKIGTWVKLPKSVKSLIKSGEVEVTEKNQGSKTYYTAFTMNAYECYDEASKHTQFYVDKGFEDSFIIAFDRGQRISSTEAKEKTKTICK
jgi:hypothetical protein